MAAEVKAMHKFPEVEARLNRAQGHLASVIEMLEAG
jgi:DNA-binding FrmR family transcriptional regulator